MVKKRRKPHRYKKKKPIYHYRIFWLIIFFLIFFSVLFYFLFFSGFFEIKEINISGLDQQQPINNQEIKKEDFEFLFEEKIESKAWFFNHKNIFLINLNNVKQEVLNNFPQLVEIKISRKFPNNLDVLMREREELAIFCFFIEEEKEDCFVLDKEGVIFKEEKNSEDLIKVTDKRKTKLPVLGEKIIDEDELVQILEINLELKNNLNLSVKEIVISLEKLIIKIEENWEIYFNLKGDVGWQLIKLRVLLEEKISEEKRKDLEYIELRFGNFANPKYKD